MSAPGNIGVAEARSFLSEHLGRAVGEVELVGAGAWSTCFGFTDADRELVIRFGAHLGDFEKDQRAASFRTTALPIPEVIEIGTSGHGYFAISSRAHGRPLESSDTQTWLELQPALMAMLDAIRGIDVAGTTGYGLWDSHGAASNASWRDFLLAVAADTPHHRTHGWTPRLIDSPVGDATFRDGLALLSDLAGAFPNERYAVHADLINRNVLVDNGRITAVFDWGCSFYGDFLYDIAWFEFWSPWHPVIAATDVRDLARRHYQSIGLAVADLDERVRCCMLHIGLDHLAYCAHTGALDDLVTIDARTRALIE